MAVPSCTINAPITGVTCAAGVQRLTHRLQGAACAPVQHFPYAMSALLPLKELVFFLNDQHVLRLSWDGTVPEEEARVQYVNPTTVELGSTHHPGGLNAPVRW